jgi:hypothetical protein
MNKLDKMLTDDADYYELPVVNWKEILGETRKNVFTRRPRTMHATLKLRSAAMWIERLLGIPVHKIEFVGVTPDEWDNKTVKDIQQGNKHNG